MLTTILPATASTLLVIVCTAIALQLRARPAQPGRHSAAALATAPTEPAPLPPAPEPEPEPAFDPLDPEFSLDEVERFLAELGVTDDMTVTHVYAEAVRENRERALADTAELEAVAP